MIEAASPLKKKKRSLKGKIKITTIPAQIVEPVNSIMRKSQIKSPQTGTILEFNE
jgi:hypothetical protein